jgi:hypothetical protein
MRHRKPICHSEHSEESIWTPNPLAAGENPIGFFAALGMTWLEVHGKIEHAQCVIT